VSFGVRRGRCQAHLTDPDGNFFKTAILLQDASHCTHTPACPDREARDCTAAAIVSDHLQDCGYALLCNGLILLEGDDDVLSVPTPRACRDEIARSA
jgi:hypothetical protein